MYVLCLNVSLCCGIKDLHRAASFICYIHCINHHTLFSKPFSTEPWFRFMLQIHQGELNEITWNV